MCGICGERSFAAPVEPRDLAAMMTALVHRGPDDEGAFSTPEIGLGHRRLAIVDLSIRGRQPVWSSDRTLAMVFNGEVYNYRDIRADLERDGYRFLSATDAEVVVNAVHRWGIDAALSRFVGMFAFAIWSAPDRSLTLARDRAGIKPLYYVSSRQRFLFASEMKSLAAHSGFERTLDPAAVSRHFVRGYCGGDETVFRDVRKIPAGHYMVVSADGRITRRRYWTLDTVARGSFRGTIDEAAGELERLFDGAFRSRLDADVPVGLFLSGGVDSSLLSAWTKRRFGADILNLTIGFNDAGFDEAPKARAVAAALGVAHDVHYVNAADAAQALTQFVETFDEPFLDTSGIPMLLLSKFARRHVTVALSADGGDEQFGGYPAYVQYPARHRALSRVPPVLRTLLRGALRIAPHRAILSPLARRRAGEQSQLIAKYDKAADLLGARTVADWMRVANENAWTEAEARALVGVADGTDGAGPAVVDAPEATTGQTLADRMMRSDYQGFMTDDVLVKVDRASMAHGLECRDPLLDHRIAELVFQFPMAFLVDGANQKVILKRLLGQFLPAGLVEQPKRGFSIPLSVWLKTVWKPFVLEYLSPSRIRAVGVLRESVVRRAVDDFYRYDGCRAERIWAVLNFQMWASRWLVRA